MLELRKAMVQLEHEIIRLEKGIEMTKKLIVEKQNQLKEFQKLKNKT